MENKIAVFYDNIEFKNRIEYTFNFIFSHYFIKKQNIEIDFNPQMTEGYMKTIYFQNEYHPSYYIKPQKSIFSDKQINPKNYFANKYVYQEIFVFSCEKIKTTDMKFIEKGKINFDIIETIFFHISRYEEYFANNEQLDHHDRMKSSEQFLVRNDLYKIPVVDHLVFAFLDSIGFKNLQTNTTYSVTHDIDAIRKFPSFYKFLRATARIIKKDKSLVKSIKILKQYISTKISKKDPYDTFDWLLSSNKSQEKIIYFMSGGTTKFDNFYSIDDERLKEIFKIAKANGYTFGLHPSYSTSFVKDQFKKEIQVLNSVTNTQIINTRQHILHFSFQKTIDILEDLSIVYDSTLGFQDLIGFRCGTGHNYLLYNFNREQSSTVLEIPLVVMDGPLLMEGNYDVSKSKEIIFDFLYQNKEFTKITFNFHNSTFDDLVCDAIKLKKLYIEINNYCERLS